MNFQEAINKAIREHIHDGNLSQRVNLFDLFGSIETLTATPTGTPQSFYDQVKIYNNTLYIYNFATNAWVAVGGSSSGTVTTVSVVTANGFAGSVANATTTPAITVSTTVSGIAKGNGTALSAAAAGTDYTSLAFKTIAVSGQSNVVADSPEDTVTFVAGTGITITTDATTDSVTFASTGGGGGTNTVDVTAGESLTAGNAVFVSNGTQVPTIYDANVTETTTGDLGKGASTTRYAVSFTVGSQNIEVDRIVVNLLKTGTPADNVQLAIQADSAGSPSGSDLTSGSISSGVISGGITAYTITLSPTYTLTASTTYWVVWSRSGANDASHYYQVGQKVTGSGKYYNGSSWSANNTDTNFILKVTATAGRLYKTTAATAGYYESFIGFVTDDVVFSNTATVEVSGATSAVSGLTASSFYYLSDTRGAISTSAGSNTKKVGIAATSAVLVITNIW